MPSQYAPLKFLFLLFLVQYACSSETNKSTEATTDVATQTTQQAQPAKTNTEKNAYFGDLHIHTSWSFDAFVFNVKIDPDDAYRFGKGEAIDHIQRGV